MTIATKNGSVIIKGGSVAQNCGCCDTGACCNGTTCSVKPQSQCNAAAGEVFRGVGTVCSPNPCGPCAPWFFDLPPTMQVELTNCRDDAYGTDFPTMNGVYTVTKGQPISLGGGTWRMPYEYAFPTIEKSVQAFVDCSLGGFQVRYSAFARTQRIYGVNGSGPHRIAPPGCYSDLFPGGSVGFLSCNFSVTCNPLP